LKTNARAGEKHGYESRFDAKQAPVRKLVASLDHVRIDGLALDVRKNREFSCLGRCKFANLETIQKRAGTSARHDLP